MRPFVYAVVMQVFSSCLLLLALMFDAFIISVFVHTQALGDIVDNRAAFVCVSGLVMVVAIAFVYC